MAQKLLLGIIGGGEGSFIGAIHYRAAMLDGEYELVCGAFSSNPKRSFEAGQKYNLPPERVYGSWEEMLVTESNLPVGRRMEVVAITTPNYLHYPQASRALENGFHVICDKPVTTSLNDAVSLRQKVEESGLVFALTHNYTGYPMVKEARQIVRSGQLGPIRRVVVEYPQGWLSAPVEKSGSKQAQWRTNPEQSGPGGCLGDIGTHAESLAEYITGLQIETICADLTTFVSGRQLDDDVSILLRFQGGAKGILFASQIAAGEENNLKIRVYGEKGGLEWQHRDPNTLLLSILNKPTQILRAGTNYSLSNQALYNLRLPGGHPEGFIEAFANVYRGAANAINQLKEGVSLSKNLLHFPTIDDGVRGMQFIEKVIESARSKEKWVSFE